MLSQASSTAPGWRAPRGRRLARLTDTLELTGGERPRRADIGATANKHAEIARDDHGHLLPHADPTQASALTPGASQKVFLLWRLDPGPGLCP
jgi:hypothetical protein